jgi:hypothetical protein
MKQRPADFDDMLLARALREDWAIAAHQLEYLPLGFGGHHWRATTAGASWFVTLNAIQEIDYLRPALATAHWLEVSAGFESVVGPRPAHTGELVRPLDERFALSVYPWLGHVQPAHDADAALTASLLKRLHAVALPRGLARTEDFVLPRRARLEAVLAETDTAWEGGPFGESARNVARAYGDGIRKLLGLYDRFVERAARDGWVITHGEPYGPNLLADDTGRLHLVDWDSALCAPRERDLWELPPTAAAHAAYGRAGDAEVLRLYRARYALAELGLYLSLFRGPHPGDDNDRQSWANIDLFLPTAERWPELALDS